VTSSTAKSCIATGLLCVCLALPDANAEIEIPDQSDWTDRGLVIEAGSGWDKRLHGAISPTTVVKKNGIYFVYYIGADGDRSTDGGPRNRALGVATSADGINFTKYAGNPVITHVPHGNQEEGVFSAAATLSSTGEVVLYYGALWASNSTTEQVDVFVTLATSQDGFSFDNRGAKGEYAFAPDGDEVDPIGVMNIDNGWYVYYINNQGWKLNLLSGSNIENLFDAGSVSGTGGSAKGGGDPIYLSETEFVTFVDHYDSRDTLVLTGSTSSPNDLNLVTRYDWGSTEHNHTATYLDKERQVWLMYYLNKTKNAIGVKTAPMIDDGSVAQTPEPPLDLIAE